MGCLFAKKLKKESASEASDKKVYSWDLRRDRDLDKNNYVIESLINEERIELPGSVNGQQFLIQNCRDSTIYILDHMNTVSIYECTDCKIILGPVKGSIYINGCNNCICVMACGQLRIRDSRKILAFVHCETQPAIEASSSISFGSYGLMYSLLDEHLKLANLNEKKRNWKVVHDFTPLQSETNWKFIESDNAFEYVKDPISEEIAEKLRKCEHGWRGNQQPMPQSDESHFVGDHIAS